MITYKRLKDATTTYLRRTCDDVYVLDESCNPIVCLVTDEGHEELVFIKIFCDANGDSSEDRWDRDEAERFAGQWLFEHAHLIDDIPVRFDEMFFMVLMLGEEQGNGKALLRHHRNCLGDEL